MIKITDTLYGVVSDSVGRRYSVFFRSRGAGLTHVVGVMARDEAGAIWHVIAVRQAETLILTLSRPARAAFEIELERCWESEEDACTKGLAIASSINSAGLGHYMPEEMWIDLSAANLERAKGLLRHG